MMLRRERYGTTSMLMGIAGLSMTIAGVYLGRVPMWVAIPGMTIFSYTIWNGYNTFFDYEDKAQ